LRRGGSFAAAEQQTVSVLDDPLDDLAAAELHGLGDSGEEVDIPLLTALALDELHFGRETHKALLVSSYITRYQRTLESAGKDGADSLLEENLFRTSQRAKHERSGLQPRRLGSAEKGLQGLNLQRLKPRVGRV
jgi:hypothetical protein